MPSKEIKESVDVPDGEYSGTIKENKVATYKEDYEYHETYIEVDGIEGAEKPPVLKVGCPFDITEKTKLGLLLMKFGAEVKGKKGNAIETNDYLKPEMKVKFSVTHKTKDNGVFCVIATDTLRPEATTEEQVK